MSVSDAPIMSLRLGLQLGSEALDKGQDVYLECKIKANPEIYKIQWRHNVRIRDTLIKFLKSDNIPFC